MYLDAARRGERKVLWGLFGFLNFPSSLVVYLLVTRTVWKTKSCPACGKRIAEKARFCPECGKEQLAEKRPLTPTSPS
jgi:ribosomal protein S27AE